MTDSEKSFEAKQHPWMATQNLKECFAQLESDDESMLGNASDALESSGPPRFEDSAFLRQQLVSENSNRVYWSCTLLGRLAPAGFSTIDKNRIQAELGQVLNRSKLDLSARERAAWAIGELGSLGKELRTTMESLIGNAPPRLKRLLESALAT